MGDALLEIRGLAKHYGTVRALDGIDLSIDEGSIYHRARSPDEIARPAAAPGEIAAANGEQLHIVRPFGIRVVE